jgi:ubiquinone/menaquinone biosynthesis C-methylase UbiE
VGLPSEIYDREYFLSEYCEGFERFEADRGLSPLKARELEMLDVREGHRVLDAGCGRGELLLACHARGATVAGIDYSAAAVEISQETLADVPGAELVHGSVCELPWPDDAFDRIVCGDVIEHLDTGEAARALSEFRRVLAPGGLLLLHTAPNRLFRQVTWPIARPVLRLTGFKANADALDFWLEEAKRFHVNEQTLGQLRRSIRRAGFQDARVWLDPNVVRQGSDHHLTAGLDRSLLGRMANGIAAWPPVRRFLSNDLYALARG